MTSSARVRRWWIVGAVLSVVLAVAVVTAVYVTTRRPTYQPQSVPSLGLPAQEMLTSSMKRQPVPGWKTTAEELGLPPGGVVKAMRNIGDRGYFLGITGTGWWLVGIDVATGRRSFAPVELGLTESASSVDCFVNGPTTVLCILQSIDPELPAHARVVDTGNGALLFDGPTNLRLSGTQGPVVEQAGDYAVATVKDEGVHGIGPHAEMTWFVPGSGFLSQQKDWKDDAPPQPIAVQGGAAYSTTDVVFSVVDGKVVKPAAPQGTQFGRALVYPGGFGYEYSAASASERVAFFDASGRELSRPNLDGVLLSGSRDLPIVRTASADVVITLDGRKLLELPPILPMRSSRLIGDRLFIASIDDDRNWQQYDLRTGQAGKTCTGDGLGPYYIASDGEVAVVLGERTPAQAIDLTTCETSWLFPGSSVSESIDVWRVNTTLIQRTNDELFSLVAPA